MIKLSKEMSEILFARLNKRGNRSCYASNVISTQMIGTKTTKFSIQVPDSIQIRFREDYDIWNIHRTLVEKIKSETQSSSAYDLLIAGTKLAISIAKSDAERTEHMTNLEELQKQKAELTQDKLQKYIDAAVPLLNRYSAIPKRNDIIDTNVDDSVYYPSKDDLDRIKVIKQYINVASKYIVINYVCSGEKPSNVGTLCLNCGADLSDKTIDADSIDYCPNCRHKCNVKSTFAKIHRCDIDENVPTSTCNDLGNFLKAIEHYQGNIKLVKYRIEDIINLLDSYFIKEGFPTGEEIKRTRPLNSKGQRDGTSVQKMIDAMKDQKISCYDYVNYICREYWGWILPNISHIKDIIVSDYNKTQMIRSTLSIEERGGKSNIPVRFRLLEHLKKRGWDCDRSDFKLPNDVDKYVPGWKIMCQKSGIPELMKD